MGAKPPDHFLLGRLVQKVGPVYSVTVEEAEWVEQQLASARHGVLEWMKPYLDGPIDADRLGGARPLFTSSSPPEANATSYPASALNKKKTITHNNFCLLKKFNASRDIKA